MNGPKGEFTGNRALQPCGERAKPAVGSVAFIPLCVKAGFRRVRAFLPAAGYRRGTSVGGAGIIGFYWSASCSSSNLASRPITNNVNINPSSNLIRYMGCSVRLVKNI